MISEPHGLIQDTSFSNALSERYLAYALSTIMSRSLPDVRDGLKPVHRRLLFAMRQLKLDPKSGFKKCARIVGDVIGKYHPHGDAAVYEALVRLAQDFAVRYPLIEGQGNFGSIDGDNAAAMRYTESRMTAVAQLVLDGIDEDSVDFRTTYDGEEEEPIVLPGAFPNLLANGASGIAVGMATNLPPHNVGEIYDAAMHLIKNPEANTEDLIKFVKGPDFPTGGLIVENQEVIKQVYQTGRGSLRVRARWNLEQGRFGTWHVVITEIPYQVQKSKLIEQIAVLMEQKKLPLLSDIRDESTDEIRIIVEPKNRTLEPEILMESLFRITSLETKFSYNMNVLDKNLVPNVMGLKDLLNAWLDHRHQVLLRRSRYRLSQLERRMEILNGFLAVYLNMDEVIRIIREEEEVKNVLISTFSLTELQAESILNMRLRSLRKLEEEGIKQEHKRLTLEKDQLYGLLTNEKRCWKTITSQLKEAKKIFESGALGKRRTDIHNAPKLIPIDEFLEETEQEPLTLFLSTKGWIRALKGHNLELKSIKFKEGDKLRTRIECQSNDRTAVLTTDGKIYNIKASDLPRGRGDGQPLRLLIDIENSAEPVCFFILEEARYLLTTEAGYGFIVESLQLITDRKNGKQIFNLKVNDKIFSCLKVAGDYVATATTSGKFLIFPIDQIPVMKKSSGVILQKVGKGKLKLSLLFSSKTNLDIPRLARSKSFTDLKEYVGNRASLGKKSPNWLRNLPQQHNLD
ncbi:DNA topoisomerase 4 subunit A [Commensalibacter sp. Nvir]|uniref:DNA topoisomerase IV subunit A n=1 Tax=Commensalibacter sp. Nvir TaxID=3069817 RepID=UPI002D7472C8|nr:DNA topoisomerase 4 subunit A [Commensalibacter sp. Nvir]